jgi:hypothetical protein
MLGSPNMWSVGLCATLLGLFFGRIGPKIETILQECSDDSPTRATQISHFTSSLSLQCAAWLLGLVGAEFLWNTFTQGT